MDAPSVRADRLVPGDLVFFNPGGGPVSHIGIYVGERRFVHAPSAGGTVRLESLDSIYWQRWYSGAKRVLR
jgi:cell wall-associated NlpC family hydrolase